MSARAYELWLRALLAINAVPIVELYKERQARQKAEADLNTMLDKYNTLVRRLNEAIDHANNA